LIYPNRYSDDERKKINEQIKQRLAEKLELEEGGKKVIVQSVIKQ